MRKTSFSWYRPVILAVIFSGTTALLCTSIHAHRLDGTWQTWHNRQVYYHLTEPLIQRLSQIDASKPEAFEAWARVVTQHPQVVRVALLDSQNRPIVAHPDGPIHFAVSQDQTHGPFETIVRPASGLAMNIPVSAAALVVHRDPQVLLGTAQGPSLWWAIALIVLTSVTMAWWLRHHWFTSLQQFVCKARANLGDPIETNDWDLDHEFDRLLDNINALRRDAIQEHQQASLLKKTIHNKVRAETKYMNTMLKRIEKKAWTDPLTHMNNRQCFQERLPEIYETCLAHSKDLCIVMIDIDHFKALNDTMGHQAGDALLHFVGELLRTNIREQDMAFRFGGDEFVLALVGIDSRQAEHLIKRMARLFGQHTICRQMSPRTSMSAGIASLREHCPSDLDDLIAQADQALYVAKAHGKNDVHVFVEQPALHSSEDS